MNGISLVYALVVLLVALFLAAIIWKTSKPHWRLKKRKWVCRLLVAGGILFAIYTYVIDSGMRAVTLYEEQFKWDSGDRISSVVAVENPGVSHKIYIVPRVPPFREAKGPVRLRILLRPERGEPLLDEWLDFPIVTQSSKTGASRYIWDGRTLEFVPEHGGAYHLEITPDGAVPPVLFVRIEDPRKRDGVRARGY